MPARGTSGPPPPRHPSRTAAAITTAALSLQLLLLLLPLELRCQRSADGQAVVASVASVGSRAGTHGTAAARPEGTPHTSRVQRRW
jgi:hypothetical protein